MTGTFEKYRRHRKTMEPHFYVDQKEKRKSVRIRSYSGPYFPACRLNAETYSVSLRLQSECGKIRTRITPNTNTFHAVQSANVTVLTILDDLESKKFFLLVNHGG